MLLVLGSVSKEYDVLINRNLPSNSREQPRTRKNYEQIKKNVE